MWLLYFRHKPYAALEGMERLLGQIRNRRGEYLRIVEEDQGKRARKQESTRASEQESKRNPLPPLF